YQQLISDFPDSPMGYVGLADKAYRQGQLALSLSYWQHAMDASPDNDNYKLRYLNVILELGLVEQANSMNISSDFDATILLLTAQYPKLFELMDFDMAAHPDDPWLIFEAGWYQALVGDEKKAIELFIQSRSGLSDNDLYTMPLCSP